MVRKLAATTAILALFATLSAFIALTVLTGSTSTSVRSSTFSPGTVDISTTPASALITLGNMAPGDGTAQSLVVSNIGTSELRDAMTTSATDLDGEGLRGQLQLTIRTIDVTTPATPCDDFDGTLLYGPAGALSAGAIGSNAPGAQAGDRVLVAGASETLCFRVDLPLATGNTYQNATTTATFTFDVEQTANSTMQQSRNPAKEAHAVVKRP